MVNISTKTTYRSADSWADRYLKCNYCQFGSEAHGCEIKAHRQHMPPMTTCQIRAEMTAESEWDRPVGKYNFAFEDFLVYCILLGYCPLVPMRRQFWQESTRQKIHVAHHAPPSPGATLVQLQWPLFTPAAPLTSLAFSQRSFVPHTLWKLGRLEGQHPWRFGDSFFLLEMD